MALLKPLLKLAFSMAFEGPLIYSLFQFMCDYMYLMHVHLPVIFSSCFISNIAV